MPKPGDLFVAIVSAAISIATFLNAVWPGDFKIKTPMVIRLQELLGDKIARAVFIAVAILLMVIAVRLVVHP